MGLDGQVQVNTRELENVFFFLLQGPLPLPFFRRDYKFTLLLQAYSAGREGKCQREPGPRSLALTYFQQPHSEG